MVQSTRAYLLLLCTGLAGCATINQTLHSLQYPQSSMASGRLPPRKSGLPVPPTPPPDVIGEAPRDAPIEAASLAASRPVNPLIERDAPPLAVNGLSVGKVRALFGQPAARVSAGPGETWTYRSGTCQVELYLFPDVSHGGLHVLDHQTRASDGEPACLRQLTDAHGN